MDRSSSHALILAGGPGTRFWPAGRRARPKHLIPLYGPRTLLEETDDRLVGLVTPERVWVVTPAATRDAIAALLPTLFGDRLVAEPEARDTAAAVHRGLTAIAAQDPDAAVLVCPADHVIRAAAAFRDCAGAALARAREADAIVLLGVPPTRPATSFGYLAPGKALAMCAGRTVHRVDRFVEKPDAAAAAAMISRGGHFWNSGMIACRAATLLSRLGPLESIPRTSIDRFLLERATDLEMIEADFDWDDAGGWNALAAHLGADAEGNAVRGDACLLDAHGNLVWSEGHLVALLGVRDLVVVHTPDATLVCTRARAEEVKALVEKLAREGRGKVL